MDFLGRARTFVRVVEAGSLSGAARSLRLSLAAISRQVASLESELDARLLVRTTRSLHLTDEGRRFHEHATRLVRDADAARASVRPEGAVGGNVVVSASVTLGVLRIVPALPKLYATHPAVPLDLRLEDRAADLVGEGVDIAVRAGLGLPDTTSLVAQLLATFQRTLVASPAYLRRHGTPRTVASLASHAAILGAGSGTGRWQLTEDGELRTVTVMPRLRVGTLLAVQAAARAGLGIAILPDFVVGSDLKSRTLRAVLPSATLAPVTAHALYRIESRGTARIEAVVRHLRTTMPFSSAPGARAACSPAHRSPPPA
jgi:DNA-binding transcriptional LysR family regulator